jgi:hypothetical protein
VWTVAESAAIESGSGHVVARYRKGYVLFQVGHQTLQSGKVAPVYEITPESACIRLKQ